ncbi:perforin-1-like [Centropristis striata]|uniref:perforin-1-like n=1 Tax=Centropristis striata TaxID=184440 RepID=UPI0027E1876C|nr:perforin-1-like [Centropristis striata]
MLLLDICIYASLMLSLPQCTYQSCIDGKPKQCVEAEFAPGTNLAGEGFDITKMERKGAFVLNMNQWERKDKTCTLCINPFLENKKQKLPLSVVDWRPNQSCSRRVTSTLHRSSESLVSSRSSSVENNWKSGLDFGLAKKGASLMLAGTNSKLAKYSMEKTKNDKFSFTSQSMSCEYYSYRVSGTPKLHREFHKAMKQLPKIYSPENKQQFYKLIDNFGTHYITKVKLGGSVQSVTSIRECQASLQGLSVDEVQKCLEVEASVSTLHTSVKYEAKQCKQDIEKTDRKSAFSSLFNDRFTEIKGGHTTEPDLLFSADKDPSAYKEWLNSLPQNPDIVSYSLDSLHELLPTNTSARKNLRSAISHYILEKALWKNCSERCQAGRKSNPTDSCVCQCHNDPAVNQDCCPTRKGMARVIITVQRASGLWGDYITATDGYVKVFFGRQMVHRTSVIYNNNYPRWAATVELGTQDLFSGKVRFEVWDEDNKWDDDLLGKCEQVLSAGVKDGVCQLNHGQLFFKLDVTCAPSLSGDTCKDYKASPMSQSLMKLYVSRHAHPVPKAVLLEMGVFVDETSSQRNQSLTAQSQKFDLM